MSPLVARLQILAAALLFSTGGMGVKSCDFNNWQIAGLRSGIAALVLLICLPAARRRWTWRTLLVGLAYGATMLLYVSANKMTTAANAIFLQATAPIYILLLAPRLLGEHVDRRDLLMMLVFAGGLGMFFVGDTAPSSTAPAPLAGNLLGALAGVSWALTVMGIRWLGQAAADGEPGAPANSGAAGAVVAGNLIVFAVAAPFALPIQDSTPTDWLWIGYLGIFQVGLAYVFLTTGMRRVPALEASLLLLVEPVFNPLWAFLVHRETPGSWAIAGGLVLVAATAFKSWLDWRRARRNVRQ